MPILCTNLSIAKPLAYLIMFLKNLTTNTLSNNSYKQNNYKQKKFSLTSSTYSISVRGPKIWNEFLTKEEKGIQSHSVFLGKIKTKLLESENERKYF